MINTKIGAIRAALACATMLAGGIVAVAPSAAQTTTSAVRGRVTTAAGEPAANATVTATSTGTNRRLTATTDAAGNYSFSGVVPGEYLFEASAGGETAATRATVAVGRVGTLNLTLGAAPAETVTPGPATESNGDEIVVTAGTLVESRTSEVATNISQQQIRSLPQTDRNFLSFAALAPGVQYIDSETNKGIQSGASTRAGVNVFIDGVSLKNNVLDGGIAGQQDSRGNPFGQLAVQEFRVLTQNYKAEYEQASAAIVTAITKSGTNEFHGEAFGAYTDRSLSAKSILDKRAGRPEPVFERKQYGVSLGGPIIKDKLFFFGAYEGNDQDRAFNVELGNRTPENIAAFGQFEGSFVSPFRADLYFGKLTFTPDDAQTFDLSYNKRIETDIQGFGGQTARTAAENKRNTVDTWLLKHTYRGDGWTNEFSASLLNYVFNPTSLNPDDPTFEYAGVITFGGKDSTQRISQQSIVLRNDVTLDDIEAAGRHVVKAGLRYSVQDYDFTKSFFVQPRYTFRNDTRNDTDPGNDLDFSFPAEARLGIGDPRIKASNSQLGMYIQDDWEITEKLELNLGLRWDFESNLFNNDYVTPPAAVTTLLGLPRTDYFDPADYITDGSNRPPFKKAFQPRLGFSYDFFGDESTVLFGGYGRYYDRNVFNNTLDEQFRLQYATGTFYFSRDGQPRDGNPTVVWDDRYLTREGLLELRATAQTGLPELFAVKNDAKPPKTDQFSLGVRQKIGIFQASVTGTYIRGNDGYTYLFATRNAAGECCDTSVPRANGFANVLIGVDGLKTRYKALFFTLDKNYTEASGWGVNIAYTLSKGEQNGNDLFSLDKITPDAYGWRPRAGDERHRLVLSGIVDLPFGFRFSTLSTLGSGQAFRVNDETAGSSVNLREIRSAYPEKNCIGLFAYCEVNFTLEKEIELFDTHKIGLAVDLFNAFNNKNYSGFDDFTNATDPLLPARIGRDLLTLPRRVQFRASYRF